MNKAIPTCCAYHAARFAYRHCLAAASRIQANITADLASHTDQRAMDTLVGGASALKTFAVALGDHIAALDAVHDFDVRAAKLTAHTDGQA